MRKIPNIAKTAITKAIAIQQAYISSCNDITKHAHKRYKYINKQTTAEQVK